MPYYRKKPVIIEAKEWKHYNWDEIKAFCPTARLEETANPSKFDLIIPTLEGDHLAIVGDMILKGVKGEFYPCKKDIFDLTYEELLIGDEIPESLKTVIGNDSPATIGNPQIFRNGDYDEVFAAMKEREQAFIRMVKESPKFNVGDKVVPLKIFFEGGNKEDNFLKVESVEEKGERECKYQYCYFKDFPIPIMNFELRPYSK